MSLTLEKADAAKKQLEDIVEQAQSIVQSLDSASSSVGKIKPALRAAGMDDSEEIFNAWGLNLQELIDLLANPRERYPADQFSRVDVPHLLASDDLRHGLPDILQLLKDKYPESTPEQTAWDTLIRMEENLKSVESAKKGNAEAAGLQKLAKTMDKIFLKARDEVLEGLYKEISSRFVELYKHLHDPDEANFEAEIEPDAAGLSLGVDFYGRLGMHPPHAMHSEGHQDSMGICIYLALAEMVVEDFIELTILDDVVMSVDTSHRREICSLLSTHFPDRQFLITTHDRTWARQLRSEGIVGKSELIEFYKWDIDTGPYVNLETDLWDRVDAYLEDNDVGNAAGLMRRGSEQFLAQVCDSLEAGVRFRLDGRNTLGDYLSGAIGKYNRLLKCAKSSAQSWSDHERLASLQESGTTASQIYQRTGAEQWVVNTAIHFNDWASLTKQDFLPIRDAFQDFNGLFICQECGSILRLAGQDMEPITVSCGCGHENWNLVRNPGGQ